MILFRAHGAPLRFVGGTVMLAALSACFYYVQLTSTGWIGHRLLLGLRRDMFAHLQKLSLRFYDNNEVGRVMSRVTSDVTSLQDLMTSGFLTVIGDIAEKQAG